MITGEKEQEKSDTVHTNSSEVFKTDETLGTAAEDHLSLKLSSTYHLICIKRLLSAFSIPQP